MMARRRRRQRRQSGRGTNKRRARRQAGRGKIRDFFTKAANKVKGTFARVKKSKRGKALIGAVIDKALDVGLRKAKLSGTTKTLLRPAIRRMAHRAVGTR